MRREFVIAIAAVLAAGLSAACTSAHHAATKRRVIVIKIAPAVAFPDAEDTSNVLANRIWTFSPRVHVRLQKPCVDIAYESWTRAFGGDVPSGRYEEATFQDDFGRHLAGHVFVVEDQAGAYPGQTVELEASVECRRTRGKLTHATAMRLFKVDASCKPERFTAAGVRGVAIAPGLKLLGVGDSVSSAMAVDVKPRGRLVLASPGCNSFEATFRPGNYMVGGYNGKGRGRDFVGEQILEAGDRHAGGLHVPGRATVRPLGDRCPDCLAGPSTFEVRSRPGRTTVRVSTGAAILSSGAAVRVRAGYQADVLCRPAGHCTLTARRLYQPNESWSTAPEGPPRRLAKRLVTAAGRPPRRLLLAPAHADAVVKNLAGVGGAPRQLFVRWSRELRSAGGTRSDDLRPQQGVIVWQARRFDRRTVWRIAYARRYPLGDMGISFTLGDVTSDRHPDVLLSNLQGSGGCGQWTLLATVRGVVRELFERDTCENDLRLADDALVIDEPVGPCPQRIVPAHCFEGRRTSVERWNGQRLVVVWHHVVCSLKRLDPASGCSRNRTKS
jgi:hypothetical protein